MASYILRPDGDTKAQWTETPAGTAWTNLNEAVTQPTVPSTASGFATSTTSGNILQLSYTTTTLAVNEYMTAVRGWAYVNVPAGATLTLNISNYSPNLTQSTAVTGWVSTPLYTVTDSTTFQAGVDAMYFQATMTTAVATATTIYAMYMDMTTTIRRVQSLIAGAWLPKPRLTKVGGTFIEKPVNKF